MERTASGNGYWLFARDGGIFTFGDAKFYGSLGGSASTADRLDAAHADRQRLLDARLRRSIYAFGDAAYSAASAVARNYGGARRLLVTPTGNGYWIATANGSVIPFGDARRLGFPALLVGSPVALMLEPVTRTDGRTRRGVHSTRTTTTHPRGARGNRAERVAEPCRRVLREHAAPATDPSNLLRVMPAEGGTCRSCALVLAGGDPVDPSLRSELPAAAFVIAADSGLHQAETLGLHGRSHRRRSRFGRRSTLVEAAVAAGRSHRTPSRGEGRHRSRARDRRRRARGRAARRRRRRGRRSRRPLPRQHAAPRRPSEWCRVRIEARFGGARVFVVHGQQPACELEGSPGKPRHPAAGRRRGARIVTAGLEYPLVARRSRPGHDARRQQRDDRTTRASVALVAGTLLVVQPDSGRGVLS